MPLSKTLTLLDMARSGSIGPPKIGAKISEIGDAVGPPTSWGGFETYGGLSFVAYFGGVSAILRVEAGNLVISHASYWSPTKSALIFPNSEKPIKLVSGFRRSELTFEFIVGEIKREGLTYRVFRPKITNDYDNIVEVCCAECTRTLKEADNNLNHEIADTRFS